MKDEIKEILDIIKKVSKAEVNSYNSLIETPPMKWGILLDYITNLEQENEELSRMCEIYSKSLYNADLTRYKSRIDKAIKYIEKSMNNPQPFYEYIFGDENGKVENLDKLLNILNGGDEE